MRLRTQWTAWTIALVATVVFSVAGSLLASQRRILRERSEQRARLLMESVARSASEASAARDDLMLISHLQSVHAHYPEVVYAAMDHQGHKTELGAPGEGVLVLARTVGAGRDAVTVRLGFSREALDAENRETLAPLVRRAAVLSALFLALGVGGAWLLALYVARSLEPLEAAARLVEEGKLDVAVRPEGPNEVKLLTRRFNTMTERLKELMTFKEDLLHTLTHELNTPLGGLKGYLELWQGGKLPEPQQREALRTMAGAVERMERALGAALEMYRSGRSGPREARYVDLQAIVRESLSVFAPVAAEKRLDLRGPADPTPVRLWGDPETLRQVVFNLVSNAVKYTPEGGSVQVRLGGRNGDVSLEVKDTGRGIPKAEQAKVFEKFERAAGAGGVPGTGLGLAIVRQAVEGLGGRIRLESEPGKGSTFSVTLPKGPSKGRPEGGGHEHA